MSAASAAKRRDPDLDVVAFERGPYTSYSACGIPYYVGGLFDDADRLVVALPGGAPSGGHRHARPHRGPRDRPRPPGPHGLRALRAARDRGGLRRARHRDRGGRGAAADPGRGGDRRPRAPSTPRERFRAGLERGGGKAVVIGAGYIGLEMAENLVDRGMAVTVIDQADQVMRTLDRDMADHVQDGAEAHGVRFLLSTRDRGDRARRRGEALQRAHERGRAARRPRDARDRRPARRAPRRGGGPGARGHRRDARRRPPALPGRRRRLRRRRLRREPPPGPRRGREHPARHARQQAGPHRRRQRDRRRRRVPGRRRDRRVEGVQVRGRPHRHHRGRGRAGRASRS